MKSIAAIAIAMGIAGTAAAADVHKIRAAKERPSWDTVPWVIRHGPVDYADESVSRGEPREQAEFAAMEVGGPGYTLFLDPQD